MQTDRVLCDVGTSRELSEPKVLSSPPPLMKVSSHSTLFHFLFSCLIVTYHILFAPAPS